MRYGAPFWTFVQVASVLGVAAAVLACLTQAALLADARDPAAARRRRVLASVFALIGLAFLCLLGVAIARLDHLETP